MAETRKTTKTKTKPTKKPTTKPATKPSVKPKAVKTVKTTPAATKPNSVSTATPQHGLSRIALIIIIIIAGLAVITGIVVCVASGCMNSDTVMIEGNDGSKIKSKYVSLDDYQYSVLIPTSFKTLTDAEIADDYGTSNAPALVYANEENTVNIAFSRPTNTLKNDQVKEYVEAMGTVLGTSMEIIDTDLIEKDGHNIGILKVVSELEGEEVYNEVAIFSYNDQLAIITFNCRGEARSEWEKTGAAIIDSIKF